MKKNATKRKAVLALAFALATGTALAQPTEAVQPASAIEAGHADSEAPEFFALRLDRETLLVTKADNTPIARLPVGTLSKKVQIDDCAAEFSFGRNPSKELFAVLVPDAKNPRRLSFSANKRHFETQPPVGQTPIVLSLLFPEQPEEPVVQTSRYYLRVDGDTLVVCDDQGREAARFAVGTQNRAVRIGDDAFVLTFGRDGQGRLYATLTADPANARALSFDANDRRFDLGTGTADHPVTLTLMLTGGVDDLLALETIRATPSST
ncbi:MAG TPA: hypothetical protein VIM58_00660, partial [Candidatus Methylacidiphilales bacterium]